MTVVDRISGSTVYAAEQNFNNTADIGSYTLSGGTLSRGSMHIRGVVHSPNNPNSNTPPSPASLLVIRTGGNLYGKANLFDNWYSYVLNPGPVTDVRVSGQRITWTGSDGHLYAKDWDATHSFGNSSYDEYGSVDQYAASSSLLVIRVGGTLYGKANLGDTWTTLAGSVADVRVSGSRITYTDTGGNVWAKDYLGGTWAQEYGSVDQYAASG